MVCKLCQGGREESSAEKGEAYREDATGWVPQETDSKIDINLREVYHGVF